MFFLFFIPLLFFAVNFGVVGSGGNVFGQTHFSDIGEFLAGGPIRIDFMPYLPLDNCEKQRYGFIAIGQCSKSTNNDKLAQFFLPNGNLLLTVTGGADYFVSGVLPSSSEQPTNKAVRDIDAQVLGITDPDFFSIITIEPESIMKYIGVFGYYVFLFNENNTPKLSFEFAMPIINCVHKTIGKETIYKTGDAYENSPIKSALEGLSREVLDYQRWNFSCSGMSRTKVTNIEFDLTYNYLPIDNCSVETYIGCLIPLQNSCQKGMRKNQFIFSPEFENLQHVGFQYGTTISLFLYQNDERSIKFILGNNFMYFLPKTHFRSFDLQGRSWSKYLYSYQNFQLKNQELEPLVNFLSFECRVSPNFSNIATSELHYIKDFFDIAIGYSLFARQSESVTILEDLPNIVLQGGNADITYCPPISIVRDIALRLQNEDVQGQEIDSATNLPIFNANYFYAKIDNTMIDIASATHPAVFCGELYIKGAFEVLDYIKILVGGAYRFSHNNTAIEYASGWAGLEFIF